MPELIRFSAPVHADVVQVKGFLRQHLYRHPRVVATTDVARRIVRELFEAYRAGTGRLPPSHANKGPQAQTIADYIAGMTDRFALREHQRITGAVLPWPRDGQGPGPD
jgi:dGTPase